METGWVFWEYENTSILTEAHAIWIDPRGRRLDITPRNLEPGRRILFLPDPRVAAKRGYTASYRTVLSDDPRVRALENFAAELSGIWDECFVGMGEEMEVPHLRLKEAAERHNLPAAVARWMVDQKIRHFTGRS